MISNGNGNLETIAWKMLTLYLLNIILLALWC